MKEIKKEFGSLEAMQKAITDKEDPFDALPDITKIVTILVNAGILRRNCDIDFGFIQGEKDKILTPDVVENYLDKETIMQFPVVFAEILGGGYASDIPQAEEEDIVLKEINEKNG